MTCTVVPLKAKVINLINGSQLAKMKKSIPTCSCHKIYRDEAVGLKKLQIYLKNYDFCENVKFGAIS